MLGLCGEGFLGMDNANVVPVDDTVESVVEEEVAVVEDTPSGNDATDSSSGCCKCRTESNGDVRCQRHGAGNWTRYASAQKDMAGALRICMNGCGSTSGGGGAATDRSSSSAKSAPKGAAAGRTSSTASKPAPKPIAPRGTPLQGSPHLKSAGAQPCGSGTFCGTSGRGSSACRHCANFARANYANSYYNSIRRNSQLTLSLNGYKMSI